MTNQPRGFAEVLLVVTAGLIGTALILTSSARVGGTFDELFYLDAGIEGWRRGSNFRLLAAGTMPLPIDVITFPAYILEQLRGEPWVPRDHFPALLSVSRPSTLLFWWLLVLTGWRIARQVGGTVVGLAAACFLCLEPNLLAHSGLATTDVAFTACLMFFALTYTYGRCRSYFWRVILPALACGLTFSAKASAMLFVPIIVTAIELSPILEQTRPSLGAPIYRQVANALRRRAFWKDASAVYFLGVAVAYLYCGCDWQAHPKIVAAASNLPPGRCRDFGLWLAENLRIFNNAGVAFWYQIQHNLRGHGSYILGQAAERAVWYHFPVALSMKMSPPILLTLLFGLLWARRRFWHWTTLSAAIMLIASVNCRVQIGVRLQLPLIVLSVIGSAIAWGQALNPDREGPKLVLGSGRRMFLRAWMVAALLWMLASAGWTWPHYLTYINELWGGSEQGERLLSDSNFDWGQGIPDLRQLIAERELPEPIALWYFGTDPAASAPPFRLSPLHTVQVRSISELRQHVPERFLAVGTTILYGSYIKEPGWLLEFLRSQPAAMRTRTFLVYDLDGLSDLER